ncbi:MAG: sister chromatid cohesion protein PDS5 [Leptolyngbya sp. Prado105]|jgi:hypothetical protein|nr:sister chromatid cohesion protein PDS5 [Leptolyngbya sp. Prado105]
MITVFFLSTIAAILGAIVSATRTYTKLKLQPTSVQEATAKESSQLQPDLDSEQSIPVEMPAYDTSDIAIVPLMPQSQAEIPLATSLKISDAISPAASIESDSAPPHHVRPVIEEIGHLDQVEETLNHLAGKVFDPDPLMRLAVAVELGELAKRGEAVDRVIALLNGLMKDTDLEVRVQAGTSLAMIPNALT